MFEILDAIELSRIIGGEGDDFGTANPDPDPTDPVPPLLPSNPEPIDVFTLTLP
jgi:hypothetical protein